MSLASIADRRGLGGLVWPAVVGFPARAGRLQGRGREDAGDGGGAAGDVEPLEDVLQVLADGGGRDHEFPGYVAVAVAAGDQGKELLLPGRQAGGRRRWSCRSW